MATISLTVPNAVAVKNIAAIKFTFPEETDGMTDSQVAKFGIRQGLKPFMRAYLASLVDKAAFETAAATALTAQADSVLESALVKAAQVAAREQADADIDLIT